MKRDGTNMDMYYCNKKRGLQSAAYSRQSYNSIISKSLELPPKLLSPKRGTRPRLYNLSPNTQPSHQRSVILGLGARWRSFILVCTPSFTNYLILHFCPLDNSYVNIKFLSPSNWERNLCILHHIKNCIRIRMVGAVKMQCMMESRCAQRP